MTDTPAPGFDLAKMNEAALMATSGPWALAPGLEIFSEPKHSSVCMVLDNSDGKANADHIAASNPAAVLALIAAYEEAIRDKREALQWLSRAEKSERDVARDVGNWVLVPPDGGDRTLAEGVAALRAAYEAEKERADSAEQSEAELVQGAKDLDLQIDDLKHKLDEARAERDARAELLRRAASALTGVIAVADRKTTESTPPAMFSPT